MVKRCYWCNRFRFWFNVSPCFVGVKREYGCKLRLWLKWRGCKWTTTGGAW